MNVIKDTQENGTVSRKAWKMALRRMGTGEGEVYKEIVKENRCLVRIQRESEKEDILDYLTAVG